MTRFSLHIFILLLFGIYPSLTHAQIRGEEDIPPPPPPPKMDTTIFKRVSPAYQNWIYPCHTLFDRSETARDSCEEATIRKALLSYLPEAYPYQEGHILLEYIVEKRMHLGWMRVIENTTGEGNQWMNQAIAHFRESEPKWCCPHARRRAVRVWKTVEIDFRR